MKTRQAKSGEQSAKRPNCAACRDTGSDHVERRGSRMVLARCDVCGGVPQLAQMVRNKKGGRHASR